MPTSLDTLRSKVELLETHGAAPEQRAALERELAELEDATAGQAEALEKLRRRVRGTATRTAGKPLTPEEAGRLTMNEYRQARAEGRI